MKKVNLLMIVLVILFAACLVSACTVVAVKSVEALMATTATNRNGLMPTPTAIRVTPTFTPSPIPATSTPSRMDLPVKKAGLQVEVLKIEKPHQIYLGKDQIYAPGKGKMFLSLGIKVTNLSNTEIPLKWNEITLLNEYGDKWYPLWGGYKKTNRVIDPLGIEVWRFKLDAREQPTARIYLGDNGYLRVIFRVPRDDDYYSLAFAGLPLIEIDTMDD